MTAPEIFVDVTTLMRWTRPAVGIVRVEQQLCRWLLEDPAAPPVRYVVYARDTQQFAAVAPGELRTHLQRLDTYAAATAGHAVSVRADGATRLKALAFRWLGHLPTPLRRRLHAFLQRNQSGILAFLRRLRRVQLRLLQRTAGSGGMAAVRRPALGFGPGSVYVSLGLDWDTKDLAELYRRKQADRFRMLLFCYDIIPIRFPHLCVNDVSRFFAHYFVDLAWCADRVLCISEASRTDLQAFLGAVGAPLPDARVIRLGADLLPAADPAAIGPEVAAHARTRYILYVGTIERRKNHEILYRAYARLAEQGVALPSLLFVGMRGWGVAELLDDLRLDPRVAGTIHLLNHVNDAELSHLYRHAAFVVFPSLYEGWGLPVAESLAHGKFCLCSGTSSIPEVGAHWVEYLDPWDLPAWTARLRYFIEHPEEVERRNREIAAGYHPQPWRATAATIMQHATELLEPR